MPKPARKQREPFTWRVRLKNGDQTGVRPDRFFALERCDGTGLDHRTLYVLEADRGTMPVERKHLDQSSLLRKILAYDATVRQNIHREFLRFNNLRVLIVTTAESRADAIRNLCHAVTDRYMFVVQCVPPTIPW